MPKWRDKFAVRASRRRYENRGKVCPICGQADPLLLAGNGLCAECASDHREEQHHLLPKTLRTNEEYEKLTVPLSLYAHRLASDLQADHPLPDSGAQSAQSTFDLEMNELVVSVAEVWLVLTYLHEQPDLADGLAWLKLIALSCLLLLNLDRIDIPKLIARASEICYARPTAAEPDERSQPTSTGFGRDGHGPAAPGHRARPSGGSQGGAGKPPVGNDAPRGRA